ncbi:MAG: hypothetical protein MZW92_32355 [Comamonadaceae bacterium]|nr:hypothetical protein [Comamonadaceae bacterium]
MRLDEVAGRVGDPDAVEIAIWFHDVICTPGVRDNEARSARFYLERSAVRDAAVPARRLPHDPRRGTCGRCGSPTPATWSTSTSPASGARGPEFRSTTDLIRAEAPHRTDGEFAAGPRAVPALAHGAAADVRDRPVPRAPRGAAAGRNVERLLEERRGAGHLPRWRVASPGYPARNA